MPSGVRCSASQSMTLVVPVQDRSGEHDLDEQDPGRDRGDDERHVADGQRDRTGDGRVHGREPVGEALGDAVGRSPEQRHFAAPPSPPSMVATEEPVLARVQAVELGFLPLRAGAERRAVLDHGH